MTIQAYGWRDLRMVVAGAAAGPAAPILTAFGPSGVIKQSAFAVGDSVYLAGHVDHDAWVGSTCYMHVHWSTSGTSVNSVKWELRWTAAAGHNTANFSADTLITLEQAGQGSAWRHMIKEDAVGFPLPDIDSLVLCELKRITNGGAENADSVFGLFVDIHYQVAQLSTKNRAPNFFV